MTIKKIKCPICLDKGFILYHQKHEMNPNQTYEHVAFCTCDNGIPFRYDGQNCTTHKTNYVIPNIDQYLDKQKIAEDNINWLREFYSLEEIKRILNF